MTKKRRENVINIMEIEDKHQLNVVEGCEYGTPIL